MYLINTQSKPYTIGTSMERREQGLSFDTKLDGVSGFIVADMDTLKSVRIYLIALVDISNLYDVNL